MKIKRDIVTYLYAGATDIMVKVVEDKSDIQTLSSLNSKFTARVKSKKRSFFLSKTPISKLIIEFYFSEWDRLNTNSTDP